MPKKNKTDNLAPLSLGGLVDRILSNARKEGKEAFPYTVLGAAFVMAALAVGSTN